MHPATVPPSDGCEQQTTTLAKVSTGTLISALGPGGLQKQALDGSVPKGRVGLGPPLHSVAGVGRGRSKSGDGPSTGPKSCPRDCSPRPSDESNTITPLPPLLGLWDTGEGLFPPSQGLLNAPPRDCRSPSQKTLKPRRPLHVIEGHQSPESIARDYQGGGHWNLGHCTDARRQRKVGTSWIPTGNRPGACGRKQSATRGSLLPSKLTTDLTEGDDRTSIGIEDNRQEREGDCTHVMHGRS